MSVVPTSFRSRVRTGVEPVARLFGRVGLTPNALTLIGFVIACIGAGCAAVEAWLVAGLVVAFGAIFDLFDGALARVTNKTSNFGAFLDSTLDRAGEAVVYIGIVWGCVNSVVWIPGAFLGATAMAAAFMVSYVRARSESLGFSPGTGMASIGLAPREVRTAIVVAALILTGIAGGISDLPIVVAFNAWDLSGGRLALAVGFGLITVLSIITTIQRILFTYRQSQTQEVNH
jgi:phosphatidylglycerophosphate synthase